MKHITRVAAGCFAATLLFATPARADIIIFTSPNDLQPEENLLFNDPSLILMGMTVEGITNQTGTIFTITGNEILKGIGGQARVESDDGNGFNFALFDAKDDTTFFTEFEANLFFFAQTSGTATITATNTDGEVETLTFDVGSGQNFFSVLAFNMQLLDTVEVTTTVALQDIRQIRVGGVQGDNVVPVPEPASFILLGLAGVATAARRRFAAR